MNHVIDHVIKIKEDTGANWVFFDDDNFFADAKRALTILHLLYDNGIRCSFLELRVDSITKDTMEELRSLEVKRVFVGWESGSDRILKLVTKGFNKKTILEKCRILAAFPEIAVDASAIIGFPTETKEDIYETIDLALEMAELSPNINFNLGTYLPYPGTKLYELVLKEGFTPPNDPDGWGTFDILAGNIKLQWLPWASDNEREILRRIDRYGKLLNRVEYSNPLVNFVNRATYQAARFRLRKKVFYFPVEIFGQEWWFKRTTRKLQGKD